MADPLELRVEDQRLLRGCSAGLNQRTAVVVIGIDGAPDDGALLRIASGAAMLFPGDPLYGVRTSDWPSAFQVEPGQPGRTAEWMLGEWVIALTVALQRWARDPAWRGRVLGSEPGRVHLAIPWQRPGVLTDCVRLALRLVELWARPSASPPQDVSPLIRSGMDAARGDGLLPSALRFALAAIERGIPIAVFPGHVLYGWGRSALRMADNFSGRTDFIATSLAQNKARSMWILREAAVPVPPGEVVATFDEALGVAESLGWPVVVKPIDQDQARGVTPRVRDEVTLHHAFDGAARYSPGSVVVEKHVEGDDHRILVVNGRMLAAARRVPAGITGDGVRSVEKLVEKLNADPRRGADFHSAMKKVVLDAEALELLADQGVPVESVPEAGHWIALRRTANISTGGTAVDVTAAVHPDNARLAERAARIIGLDIAGIDFLTTDIGRSWREVGGVICEVNSQPGFRPHWLSDPERDLNGEIIELLLDGRPGRIPTAAITGTNGKGTTALMLQHIWMCAGKVAGVCTTQEVRIGSDIVSSDNLSGYPGGRIMLTDPATEVAVIEMPRKGLIEFGHPCDRYDVAALLNVQDDHLGVDGIETMEQMAELKAEVLERARDAVVVNADDPLCVAMLTRAGTDRHILVATDPAADPVVEHLARGGEAVILAQDGERLDVVLAAGAARTVLLAVPDIPAAMAGLLRYNVRNAMFAAALAWAQGIDPATIRDALGTFTASVAHNPGRYNFLDGFPFQVFLDYAHNPAGAVELSRVVAELPVTGRRIVCNTHVGNRHPSHLELVVPVLADAFDVFVLSCSPEELCPEYAAGGADPVVAMITRSEQLLADAGVPDSSITVVADLFQAIRTALRIGQPGDLVVLLAAPEEVLPVVEALLGEAGPVPSTS